MEEQNEADEMESTNARLKSLGFVPQKENIYNKYLPYADKLDFESQKMLEEIKNNLAKAVAIRELFPGISTFSKKLHRYIRLFGLKFSKEDHIKFIKLYLELITIPDLDPLNLFRCISILSILLRKSRLISPDDLQIEWRPLYELAVIYMNKNSNKGELYRYFSIDDIKSQHSSSQNSFLVMLTMESGFDVTSYLDPKPVAMETVLQICIQLSTPYFPETAVKEILDEFLPQINPYENNKYSPSLEMMIIFLNREKGFELWFDDFMNLWRVYHNTSWNVEMMSVMAVLAEKTIGQIDWEPYIPIIFSRILRSIDLPVSFKKIKCARNPNLLSSAIAQWIVSTLGPKSSTQKMLGKFIGAIESYLHPANSGKWVNSIGDILIKINKLFIDRLEIERFKKPSWQKPIPESHKLTEECITAFVESMKPIAFQAMYSQMNYMEVSKIFKNLADLRPELIIPGVIERVYSTLDSVTEPHKLTASLQCLIGVSRALISGHNNYTEYRTHVIPILMAVLPGIDPNDLKKTSVTLNFLTSFALFVPIIDCSKAGVYRNDLTEDESLICAQTAEFEDFIFQYLDKIFLLIDSSAVESIRLEQCDLDTMRSKLESVVENVIHSSVHGVLGQCSDEILCAATKKVTDRIKTCLYEPKVAGQLIGSLLRVFGRVAGQYTFKIMVPFITETIQKYINDHDDIENLDKQKDDFIYYLILLLNIVRGDPNYVLDYLDDVLPIIDQVIKFNCKLTIRTISTTILGLIGNISALQTFDVRSVPDSYNKPLSEFLPIRHWGEKTKRNHEVGWYIPNERSRLASEQIIYRYLITILDSFEKHISNEISLTRDEINRGLSIIIGLVKGSNFLPKWEELPLKLIESEFFGYSQEVYLGFENQKINMPDGTNIRLAIINTVTRLQNKILETSEDDTKSLKSIIAIWERIHLQKHNTTPFDTQLKTFMITKKFQDFHLTKFKSDLRTVLATRVMMQHDYREESNPPIFTETHKLIMMNLFRLSTSHYSNVRCYAQNRLITMMNMYPYSHRCLVDDLVKNLKLNSNDHHECFKGTLYIIGGLRSSKIIVKNDWETIQKLWIALLNTNLSEKPSIVRLTDLVQDTINSEFPTLAIEIFIPDKCVDLALNLGTNKNSISQNEIETGKLKELEGNKQRKEIYFNILETILNTVNSKSLHWRFNLMASSMLYNLVHPKCYFTATVTKYAVNNLINDSIDERKIAIRMINFIMRQQKREHIKIIVDPYKIAGVEKPNGKLRAGIRDDNRWMQYDINKAPKNQIEWDEPRYIYKINGFLSWPKEFKMYAPSSQQPKLDRTLDEMSEIEKIIFNFFTNSSNVTALVKFWSLEEKKGKDKFNRARYILIKHLCSTFGDSFLENFYPHISRLIESDNTDSHHRCAAELLTGIMRGAKHWPYNKTEKLYNTLVPLIRTALCNISVESDVYWGTCFASAAEHMDPHKQHWLHSVLRENFFEQKLTSFIGCNRIYCMQGALAQHIWRMHKNSVILLEHIRPYLSHSFQNVRERLASLLINIFEADFTLPGGNEPLCPKIKDLINEIIPKLAILLSDPPNVLKINNDRGEPMSVDNVENSATQEYEEAIRLFKTIAQWITGSLNRAVNINRKEYFQLIQIACRLERTESDIELNQISNQLLAMISLGLTLPDTMECALQTIYDVSLISSWSARIAILDVMQIMIFYNMAIVQSRIEWIEKVQEIVLRLLEDTVLEVREKAAQVLGGLIHCSFLPATDKLLEQFKRKCKTKVIRTSRNVVLPNCALEVDRPEGYVITETKEAHAVRQRHTGVLGLCAFISAYPYDIPNFVPDVFEQLGAHLNDPQPIPSTIRKTVGNFKRTHHDNWAVHQLKFTENQLAVLSDLTVPPSYYA